MGKAFIGFTKGPSDDSKLNILDFIRKIYDNGHFIYSQNSDRYLGYVEDCPCETAFADDSAELLNLYQDDPYYIVDSLIDRLENAFDNFTFEVFPAEYNPCCIQLYPLTQINSQKV